MSNLQPNCCLEFDFRKVDQHAGGKWLIHDTKRRKDNQLQSLKLPCRISKLSSKMWHKGDSRWFSDALIGIQFNIPSKTNFKFPLWFPTSDKRFITIANIKYLDGG